MKGVYYFLLLLAGICLTGSLTAQQKRYVGGYAAGYSLAPVNFGVTVSAPSVLCEHAPATFTAALVASGIGSYSYEWWKTGGSAPCSRASEFKIAAVRLSDAGDYSCRVTDQNGISVVSETVTLKVGPIAVATITAPSTRTTTICYGQELTLTGSSSVSGATFSWRGMEVAGALNGENLQVKPTVDRDYILKTDNLGCSSEDTITVKVNHPQVDIPYMKNASEGSVLEITACDGSGNPMTSGTGLTWTTKPATSSRSNVNPYSLTASSSLEAVYVSYNNAGCIVGDTTLINTKGGGAFRGGTNDGFSRTSVNFGLKLDIPAVLCEKDSSTFKTILYSAGMETYTYAWKKVGESGVKSTTDSYKILSAVLSDAGKYYCELKDPTGVTVYSDTVTLKVNVLAIPTITTSDAPPVALGRVMTICYGDTLRLAGTCNVSDAAYTWRGVQIAGVSNTKTLKALPLSTGDYILKTDNAGCFREDTVTVLINRPVADIPYVQNATDGGLLEITALDINGVALTPATGLTWTTRPATAEKKDVNPYSLTATSDLEMIYVSYNRAGCIVKDSTLINSKGGGSFRGGINDGFARTSLNFGVSVVIPEVLCQHTDTAFHATVICAEDADGYNVEWFKVGTPDVSKSTDWRFPLPDAALSDAGDYFCKVSNVEGLFVYSDTVTLKVNEVAIARIVQPARRDTMICYGDTLSLFGGTSVADAAISWRGIGIVGNVNTALTEVAPLSDADYILKADNQGCATEDTITVKVNKPYVDIPTIINTTEGSTLLLTAVDAAQQALPPAGLEWKQKPATFINANCNPLVLPGIKKDMTIEVTRVSDGCPVVDSTRIVVKNIGAFRGGVNDGFAETCLPPVILVQPTAGDRQCVSTTQTLDLKVVAEGTSIVYRWEKYNSNKFEFEPFIPAHSGIIGANSATLSFQNMTDQDNGQYRCVLSNACSGGDIITDTCRVSVKGEPVIISGINVDQDQCAGSGPFEFNVIARNSAGTGSLKYRWYKDGRQISAEADTSKNYYKFTIGPNTSAEGLYVVEVRNNCGAVYDTAFLPVILPPSIVDQSVDIYACAGGLAEFWVKTNRDEKYRYELYKLTEYSDLSPKELVKSSYTNKITLSGVTAGGFYQFRVYHERCGSVFSTPMTLHIEKPVVIKQHPRDTTLCAGGTVTLKVKAETDGNTPINYQWYKDGVLYGSRTAVPVLTIPNIAYERDTVRYECVASNSCKSVRTKVAKIAVKRAPVISHGPVSLPEYCEGDTLNLEVQLATPMVDIDSVRWFYQGKRLFDVPGKVSGATTLALEIDSLTSYYGGGYYYMEVYNQCSSAVSRQTSFKLLEPARFLRDLSAGVSLVMCSGDEQELIVQATGSPSIRYIWTQNDVVIADGYLNRLNVSGVQLDKRDKFTCHIQNTCGDELTTAYIVLSKAKEFAFEGGGHFCERDAAGTTACLRGSDTSVLYQLYRRPNVLVSEIHGRDVVPAFGDICFQKLAVAGEYYVTGVDTNRCETTMPGVATVIQDPIPVDYNFYITRHLCQDGSDADLELAGSEVGVDYYLCKMKLSGGWDTVPTPWAGNGARIRFILSEGTYKIVAKRLDSGCSRDLSSIVNVMRRPLPDACALRFVNNDSVYCSNSLSDVRLQYGCFEAGSSYQLKRNNTNYSSAKTAIPVLWNGLEEGTYSIQVTNSWGCTATFGHSVVKKQTPPARHTLIGRNYYCKDEVGNSWVELTSSDAGIRYSFRYHTNQTFKDTLSKGGAILLQVPLSDRDYYVVAMDTTPEHCTVAMYDTIVLRQSRLTVTPTSPVTIGYQDQTTLNIAVSGVVGTAVYLWTPANLLEIGQTTVQNPKTDKLTGSAIYHVVVKDNSGCPVEADVVVNVMGGDLAGNIRDKSGVNPVDTVRLCKGEPVELSAVISGGYCGGAYTYAWKDENGPLTGTALLTPYKKEDDGHIYLEVVCGNEVVRDTVTVLVNYTPTIDTILQPGLRCPASGDPVTISLKRSDPNTFYYLDYSTDRNVWQEIKQGNGNGGVLDFVLSNATSYAGYFRVRARLPHIHADGGYCEKLMYGEVEIREGAPAFTVTGDTAYCADAVSVMTDIRLSGQAAGVTYTLYHVSGSVAGVFAGPEPDGLLHFRQMLTDDRYIIKGKIGVCERESLDTIDVVRNPQPGMGTLVNAGQYCGSECPVSIGITQGEPNVTYTLTYRPVVGIPSGVAYTGVGGITFGNYCDLGSYSLKAENTLTGCRTSFNDSVIIAATPGVFGVTGDTSFCENSLSVTVNLRLTGGVTGVAYTLYRLPDVSSGVGTFTGPEPDGLLHFRQALAVGRYIVKGKAGTCERESLDTIDVVRNPQPGMGTLTNAGQYCSSECPVSIGITQGEPNVTYTLTYRPVVGVPSGVAYTGVGGITFGNYCDLGSYSLKAENTLTGCRTSFNDSVIIAAIPGVFGVAGDTSFCENSLSVTVNLRLTGGVTGVTYTLYRLPNVSSGVGTFTGPEPDGLLHFRQALTAGRYIVKGKAGTCERESLDTIDVVRHSLPSLPSLTQPYHGCENPGLLMGLSTSSSGAVYTLYRDNLPIATLNGVDGTSLNFGTYTIPGTYHVKAGLQTLECTNRLLSEYNIEKTPGQVAMTGSTTYCENVAGVTLGLNGTENNVRYKLQRYNMLTLLYEDVAGGVITGNGSVMNFTGIYPEATYRVVAGMWCETVMGVPMVVTKVKFPVVSLKLQREGNACTDSTVVLYLPSAPASYDYQLYKNGVKVGAAQAGSGSRLDWTLSPATEGIYYVRTEVAGCAVTIPDSTEIGRFPTLVPLKGDTIYCQGSSATLYLPTYNSSVTYKLYDLPGDTVVKMGTPSGARLEFKPLKKGNYYVRAFRGDCEDRNLPVAIDSVKSPVLPVMEVADCVDQDSGWIKLKGLVANNRYVLGVRTIERYMGDSTFRKLTTGIYALQVTDTLYGCRSAIITDTIREGVYNDSLIPPFAYCAGEQGVRLKLSGVRRGVKYSILTTGGTVFETVRYPSLQFSRFYPDGHYIFRRERESFPAGCLEETLFKVDKFELPKQDLAVTLIGANPACSGSNYEVEVAGTENGIRYILQRISPAANIDTLFGDGGTKRFVRKFSDAGEYRVVASDTFMYCAASLTQTVKVFALPSVSVTDGEYCYTAGSVPPAVGASIRLSGMEQNVLYRLDMLDTLYGPGTALFKKQLAGTYNVVAEDLSTGCMATYPAVINTKPGPNQYTMTSGCYPSSDVIDIGTNGSDAGVNYYLYRDGVKVFPAVTRPGTGAVLSFGDQDISGVYKIWAESSNSCGLFLRDSVVVYQTLKSCDLTVVGSFCSGETTKGVELRMACSVLGWTYYITNGFYTGDTLAGNGGILAWSKLDHNKIPIRNGVYDLRALNACGNDVLISTATVGSGLSPTPWPLKNKPQWYCAPERFSLELVGSDLGVRYTVKRYSTSGVLVQTYPAVTGTGNPLVLGTSFAAAGIYEVLADNGCPSPIAMWEVKSGVLPVQYPIVGADVCKQTIGDSVRISIPVRQNGISYYLYKDIQPDGLKVDSLTLTYRPAPELNFKAQGDIGCYYVVGASGASGCRREMTGRLCLNTSPNLYRVEPVLVLGDTLRTCRGADTSIWLSGSEAGIGYELLQNGARVHAVTGTGSRLKVGPVKESGIYKVRAYVCGVMMQDSVIVKVNELPMLNVDEELRYCENTVDTIKVQAFTSDQRKYTLYRPDGSWVEDRVGRSDGAGFAFVTPVDVEGFYYIEAKEIATGCIRRDSTKVTMERQPVSYDLTSTNGEYICRGSYVYVGLTGSEAGVRYELHRFSPAEKLTEKVGPGTALRFDSQVKMAGIYYVRGIHQSGLGCSVDFGSLTLKQADTLYPYQLESLLNSYCITSATPMGSVLLGGSQVGKEYFLLKDGVLMENSRKIGTGGALTWTGLEGKACNDNALVDGYVYRAVVRDPVSGCERNMYGADTIVAASPLKLLAQEPKSTDIEKCEGSEVKFSVTVSGCRANYLWTRYGAMLKSGKEPFYNIDVVRPQDYGVYQCIVTNSCGTLTVPATNLKVRELVVLEEPMPDERICNENTKSVMFSAGFKYAETYAWYKLPDDVTVLGTRDFYEVKDLKPSDAGTYVCVAGNRCVQNVRDTVELFFGGAPEIEIDAPRTDTLCFGSDYKSLTVTSDAPLLWFLNGIATGVTGDFYQKNSITRADEGSYSVRATNACGTTTLPVGLLYVDDTLKVFKVTDENIIRCPNDGAEQLYIDVRPRERVSYTWTDVNNNVLGTGNTLNVGPFAQNTSTYYRVWYMNKCSSGTDNSRSIGIRVPDTIHFTDPLRDIVLCADCATDTVLRLKVPGTIMAGYEWYYREKKDDVNRKVLSYADTIAITACTRNTGYYYCRVFNRCETKTTQTTWIRIDSVPVINTSLPDDTICEGGWIGIKLSAMGGGLTYRWNVLKKDGTLKLYDNHRADFVSEDELVLSNVDISFDSCRIWCQVFNTCGITQSDTMVLRVDKRRELKVDPSSVTICGGGVAEVELTMENGVLPWKYRYTIDGNGEQEVTESVWMKDTLTVTMSGSYQVTYFEDALGCIRTTGLPSFDVTERPKPTATISGGGEVCMGSEVSVQVSVTGGVGPWKVHIYRLSDGLPADELPVSCPMIMPIGKRDSTFKLPVVADETYYIEKVEDLYDGQAVCDGFTDDGRAILKVNQKLAVRFTPLSDNHVGMCRPIDLFDKLKPFISNNDGTRTFLGESDGKFYVDTKALPNKWWVKNDLKRGPHTIKYVYVADGCSLSPEVELIVDTLPSGVIDLDKYICRGGGNTDMTLTLSGAAPFKIDVLKNWIQYGGMPGTSNNRIGVPVTGSSYVENPVGLLPTDSCVFYTISNITDKHGCKSDQVLKDTLIQANKSEFNVEVRYPNREGVAWQPALLVYNIPSGDSLGVRFTQTLGNGYPWHVIIADNNNLGAPLLADLKIHRKDTVISLKEAYTYLLRPVNDICGQNPWGDQILVLNHMDTGYIRARVLLEGAYTNGVPQQKSTLEPYLPLYGVAALPANCVGHVVDWIEVEVRSNIGGFHPADSAALLDPSVAVLCRDTCLVLDDGTIVDRTGNDTIALPHCCVSGSTVNNCFIVLRHRNHLAVMSADAWNIVDRNNRIDVKTIDFTNAARVYLRSGNLDKHMKEVRIGVWAMVAGELNSNKMAYARGANNVISTRDSNIDNLKLQSTPGYYLYDVNFDGVVDWPGWRTSPSVNSILIDWLLVNTNRNRFTEINFSDMP